MEGLGMLGKGMRKHRTKFWKTKQVNADGSKQPHKYILKERLDSQLFRRGGSMDNNKLK